MTIPFAEVPTLRDIIAHMRMGQGLWIVRPDSSYTICYYRGFDSVAARLVDQADLPLADLGEWTALVPAGDTTSLCRWRLHSAWPTFNSGDWGQRLNRAWLGTCAGQSLEDITEAWLIQLRAGRLPPEAM